MFRRQFLPVARSSNVLSASRNASKLINDKFTLLTYNMLSPSYMWPQVYTYVPDPYKDWQYRHKLLESELLGSYKADIMCLQEMTSRDYNENWKRLLGSGIGYGSKFIAKSPPLYWEREVDEIDGVGIFYNLKKFDFISSSGIYLNQFLNVFSSTELEYLHSKRLVLTDGAGVPIGEKNLLDVISVSYTHLDVYKRQILIVGPVQQPLLRRIRRRFTLMNLKIS